MLEIKKYTTEELLRELGISSSTWKRRKEEFLEHFRYYFDYEIIPEGRVIYYAVLDIYAPYEPLLRKSKREECVAFYKEATSRIIKSNPWNTGANIANNIVKNENKYNHAVGTAANYVRPILKEEYQISAEKQWMQKDYDKYIYIPLEVEQEEYLLRLFRNFKCSNSDIIADYRSGYIDKEDAKLSLLNNELYSYDLVMQAFAEKYGFRPIKVGKYEEKPF